MDWKTCDFKCLKCKYPSDQCLYDDPAIGTFDQVEYPEFFWWRLNNLPEKVRPKVLTPDSMDEFYKEPKGDTTRCPRCLSRKIDRTHEIIKCKKCGYAEDLIDFPCNLGAYEPVLEPLC